ncbi:MAG: hypothetical protein ACJ8FY_05520 [Gemmataceae bacterium]
MQYKTIVLELLQQQPEIHDQLRRDRKLLATVEMYARELKASHEAWKETLGKERPDSDQNQIAFEALEMALKDLEDRLPSASLRSDNEPISLDAAMAFIKGHTSRG